MRLSEKDLVKKFWRATEFLPGMRLHIKEMKQESCQYFVYACMLIVFPHESNVAKNKAERDF